MDKQKPQRAVILKSSHIHHMDKQKTTKSCDIKE